MNSPHEACVGAVHRLMEQADESTSTEERFALVDYMRAKAQAAEAMRGRTFVHYETTDANGQAITKTGG